jgi:hypothetical protein
MLHTNDPFSYAADYVERLLVFLGQFGVIVVIAARGIEDEVQLAHKLHRVYIPYRTSFQMVLNGGQCNVYDMEHRRHHTKEELLVGRTLRKLGKDEHPPHPPLPPRSKH